MIHASRILAATVLIALPAMRAHAQSSAEASVSNIRVQLTDLDPSDGIAPSMTLYDFTFGPTAGWETHDAHNGTLRGDSRSATVPLGPISIAETFVEAPHLRSDLSAGLSGTTLSDTRMWTSASMTDTVGASASNAYLYTGNVWFVLSPRTSITISADLSVRSSAGPVAGPGLHAIGYASAAMGLYASRQNVWQSAPLYHNAAFGQDRGPGWDATYSLSFANTDIISSDLALGFSLGSSAYTSAVIPAPVPEPSSVAMLLAGLTLVGVRARRARRDTTTAQA